jgi:hypothetical protein
MPYLIAVSSFPAPSSTGGALPRYAAHFQFLTDSNEQYAILNIHLAKEIFPVKKGSKKGKKI